MWNMTKFLLMACALLITVGAHATTLASADDTEGNQFQVRVEPQWVLFHELSVDFQFRLTDHFSLGPTLAYMSKGDGIYYGNRLGTNWFSSNKTNRESLGVRAVYYFNGFDVKGAFLSGFGRYSRNHITSDSSSIFTSGKGEFTETAFGVTGGYQWVWGGRFTLNIGGGIGSYLHPSSVALTDNAGNTSDYNLGNDDIGYVLDFGLGLQF
jgi:hypothetical protein